MALKHSHSQGVTSDNSNCIETLAAKGANSSDTAFTHAAGGNINNNSSMPCKTLAFSHWQHSLHSSCVNGSVTLLCDVWIKEGQLQPHTTCFCILAYEEKPFLHEYVVTNGSAWPCLRVKNVKNIWFLKANFSVSSQDSSLKPSCSLGMLRGWMGFSLLLSLGNIHWTVWERQGAQWYCLWQWGSGCCQTGSSKLGKPETSPVLTFSKQAIYLFI